MRYQPAAPLSLTPSPCRLIAMVAMVVAAFAAAPVLGQVSDASDQSRDRHARALASAEASQLTRLAETGRFGDLLARLRADLDGTEPDAATRSLIADLERFEKNELAYKAQRAQTIEQKLDEARKAIDADRFQVALPAIIEAHGLSDEPDTIFAQPVVVDTVARARQMAQQAEADHDWVESSSIYRLLDLLYEEQGTYKQDLRRTATHIRVLGMYAPDVLARLYDERAERLKAAVEADDDTEGAGPEVVDEPEMPRVEPEHWSERLAGVDQAMLEQALLWSARRHVDHGGYKPMMLGAVEGLLILVDTKGLDTAFEGMAEVEKLTGFREHVERTAARLKDPEAQIDRPEAQAIIDRVLAVNESTIKLPESVLIYEMGEGAMGRLDDFSGIIWPRELETFNRSTQGAFYGVGIQISRRDGRLVVVSPLENTPAQRAGIKAGDIIATVDGQNTDAWSLNRAVSQITGPEGTEVKLGIERGTESLSVTLTRAKIEIESIRGWEHRPLDEGGGWDYWIDEQAGLGYVRLSQFIPQTADDLDAAIAQMQRDRELRGLILDLRFNPGGLLDASIDVADRFIDEGPIVSTVDGLGNKTNTERARRFRTYEDFPVVVLINEGSASASEIVAGALQDYGRAMIVGARSFGKGSVQDLFGLSNHKARLKLTRQYYMLPLGRIIHRKDDAESWGIEPDLTVKMTTEQIADALEMRQEADVLREGAAAADVGDADAEDEPVAAADILDTGVDPQLQGALLILKTHQLANRLVAADEDDVQALLNDK